MMTRLSQTATFTSLRYLFYCISINAYLLSIPGKPVVVTIDFYVQNFGPLNEVDMVGLVLCRFKFMR